MSQVELIEMPEESVEVARERVGPIHRSWAAHGGRDLDELVLSVYLQGVWDGWQACEKAGGKKPEGGGVILILLLAAGFVCVCFFALVLFVSLFIIGRANSDTAGLTGGAAKAATWNAENSNSSSADESVDLRQGGLKCISLPGVKGTPAVDRRVYPWLMAANKDVADARLPPLTYTWTFRTNEQQRNVRSTYGPKAAVNSSYHEAGAAVDVNGMTVRPDRFRIVQIFAAHKATWLGGGSRPDPPHFHWAFDVLGEPSKYQMIRRAQEAYQRGDIIGNCLGGNGNG